MMGVENIETMINRPNAVGDTVLHQACRMNMPKKAALLIKHGANYLANNKDEMPFFSLVKSNHESDINSFKEELQTEIEDFVKSLQEKFQNLHTKLRNGRLSWKTSPAKETVLIEVPLNMLASQVIGGLLWF